MKGDGAGDGLVIPKRGGLKEYAGCQRGGEEGGYSGLLGILANPPPV